MRPVCPVCSDYMDRERTVKGQFYTHCWRCNYDSRYSEPLTPTKGSRV